MNFKTALVLFIIGTLISCASNNNKPISKEDRIIYPDGGKSCCE